MTIIKVIYVIATKCHWKVKEKQKIYFPIKPQKSHPQKEGVAENTLICIL